MIPEPGHSPFTVGDILDGWTSAICLKRALSLSDFPGAPSSGTLDFYAVKHNTELVLADDINPAPNGDAAGMG